MGVKIKQYFLCWKPRIQTSIYKEEEEQEVHDILWEGVAEMTTNFTKEIGRGGTSIVYKANFLSKRKKYFAVKVLKNYTKRAREDFMNEYTILSRISHPNIIKLFAFCNQQEKNALVMEYHGKGTLSKNLFDEKGKNLGWNMRKRIALQVASALEYLHCVCDPPIVHCDVKSTNILLDDNSNAVLCDFGSASIDDEHGEEEEVGKGGRYICGSPGYVDPSCYITGRLATKHRDIYSLGVVLGELLSGMKAFSEERQPKFLSLYLDPFLGGLDSVMDVVDERLDVACEGEVEVMGLLAKQCMCIEPSSRPSISHVMSTLHRLL